MIAIETARAINALKYRRGGYNTTDRSGRFKLTATTPRQRYGVAEGQPGRALKLLHRPKNVCIVWHHGRPITITAEWVCGGYTYEARFVDDPQSPGTRICTRCAVGTGCN